MQRQLAAKPMIGKWIPDGTEALRTSFECTDWNVLLETDKSRMDTGRQVAYFSTSASIETQSYLQRLYAVFTITNPRSQVEQGNPQP